MAATVAVEAAMFGVGLWLYARATRSKDRIGTIAFWAFVIFVLAFYAGAIFGPPAPDPHSLAVFSLSLWLFPLWALWFDRHRTAAA